MMSLRGNCAVLVSARLLSLLWLSWLSPAAAAPPRAEPAQASHLFDQQIRPLLEQRCAVRCVGADQELLLRAFEVGFAA